MEGTKLNMDGKKLGDFSLRAVTLEELGIFPQNDIRNGSEDESYRVFRGQMYMMLPQITSDYRVMSLSEILQARTQIARTFHFAEGPRNTILNDSVTCRDGYIVNRKVGEIKVVRDVLDLFAIDGNTPHVSWGDPSYLTKGMNRSEEEIKELDLKYPSGSIFVSDDKYASIDGFVIPVSRLDEDRMIHDENLKEQFMGYLLDGNFGILNEYFNAQGIPGILYDEIPINFTLKNGLKLIQIDSFSGKRRNKIDTESFVYNGGQLATKVVNQKL